MRDVPVGSASLPPPRERPSIRAHRTAGFSILELTITTLISAGILILVSQILLQSARLSQASAGVLTRANLEFTESHLRHDSQAAQAISPSLNWTSQPLTILHPKASIRYALVDGRLIRESTPLGVESPISVAQTLAPLNSFQWRSIDGSSLWVQLQRATPPDGLANNPFLSRVDIGLLTDRKRTRLFFHASRQQRSRGW